MCGMLDSSGAAWRLCGMAIVLLQKAPSWQRREQSRVRLLTLLVACVWVCVCVLRLSTELRLTVTISGDKV